MRPSLPYGLLALQVLVLALAGSLLCGARTAQDPVPGHLRRSPLSSGDVRELELRAPPGTWTGFFRIDAAAGGTHGEPVGHPLGAVQWVAGPTTETAGGWRIDTETTWFDAKTRVYHAERLRELEKKLVWREVRARGGRTVLLVPAGASTCLESLEPVAEEVVRRFRYEQGLCLPLELVDRARRGEALQGDFRVFVPLSHGLEELRLSTLGLFGGWLRRLEMRRGDGTLAGRYLFVGDRLVAFRLQERGPLARAIPAEEHAALVGGRGVGRGFQASTGRE